MIQTLRNRIVGKRVLILGFGREGRSTYQALKAAGGYAGLAVADQSPRDSSLEPEIPWFAGADHQKAAADFDLIFKSPGVVLDKGVEEALRKRLGDISLYLTSQTQEFFSRYRDQIIGITGTKGKSTTTTLLFHILKENGFPCLLAGNIGIPVFDVAGQMNEDTLVVCELSCHQLEYMTVSPRTAILTNIHEEHLDHYGSMEKYVASKKQVYLHQRPEDVFFCNSEDLPAAGEACGKLIPVYGMWFDKKPAGDDASGENAIKIWHKTIFYDSGIYRIPLEQTRLVGEHNCFDIGIAYAVCRKQGISDQDFTRALCTYEPLPHRLQYVGCFGGIKYYDDSISTICDTAIQALHSVEDADTILIGGMDRGIDYEELIRALYRYPKLHVILMEATGRRIDQEIRADYQDFPNPGRLYLTEHLEDAVKLAAEKTRPGRSCVLSPAAASYGIFKNFEERGEAFQELVKNGV
ncbi:MAG: UDP-N-acetylmuramoyl-L-alanine--D-glutamate ligase [Lachnospiraceae bacterium]|nr:UDP-N-acetylmuramoyl-L-alanine--D-glutamate ligase [Lachnospiraceae bacterium]